MEKFFVLNDHPSFTVPAAFAGYVIFYRKSKDEKVAEVQTNLMDKLIQNGLKLSMDNFLFIDLNEHAARVAVLQQTFTLKKCFLFGVKESEVGINFDANMYQLTTVSNIEFLKADSPEKLEQDKNLKNKLWIQLQLSFNLTK